MADTPLYIAKGENELHIVPKMANRHGLITGATGTGKTVTLQSIAESFSSIGTPVFLSDIKGDLGGICEPGGGNSKVEERIKQLEIKGFSYRPFPVQFWDVFGNQGFPVRTTVSDMGPLLLSRLLDLNETQTGVLNLVFRIADDQGMLLLDLKDLKAMLVYVAENASRYTVEYGTISKQSVGAIQRALLVIEEQGGEQFFGEPALDINDFMKKNQDGLGIINILASDKLFHSPALYSTFLLWLLSELFEELPEVGDLDQPKLVFFFDEAHILFNEAPKVLLERIEQVVRLIRSKGVGVYFITQNPVDIPDSVLGQLGNRVQHALRAFTPKDQKAIKAAAATFRQNPKYSVEQVITELAVGEALVSFLDEKGRPSVVEKAFVIPPRSKIGPIAPERRKEIMDQSSMGVRYEKSVDRESAYELLQAKAWREKEEQAAEKRAQEERAYEEIEEKSSKRGGYDQQPRRGRPGRKPDTMVEKLSKTAVSSVGRQVARELVRGILGSLLRK